MAQESIVYGCIKDMVLARGEQAQRHRQANRAMMASLPGVEDWPLLAREMFSAPPETIDVDDVRTDVIHFGSSYKGIEHEWNEWMAQFERLLRNMYWVSATVHLETAYNGIHTFVWETDDDYHVPNSSKMHLRCQWTHETALG